MNIMSGVALVAAFLWSACAATAATVTYSETRAGPFVATLIPGTETFDAPLVQTIALPRFNTAMGVLTGVAIKAGIKGTASGDFHNCISRGPDCENESITLKLGVNGFPGVAPLSGQSTKPLECLASEGLLCSNPASIALILTAFPPIAPASFAAFTGVGNFDVAFQYLPFWTLNARIHSVTASDLSAEVTYTYETGVTPVPLPAGLPLLLGGLGLLGIAARRRPAAA